MVAEARRTCDNSVWESLKTGADHGGPYRAIAGCCSAAIWGLSVLVGAGGVATKVAGYVSGCSSGRSGWSSNWGCTWLFNRNSYRRFK